MKYQKLKKRMLLDAGIRDFYIDAKVPEKIKERFEQFLESFPKRLVDGRGLLISGARRSGKTSLLSVVVKYGLFCGVSSYLISFHDIMKMQFGDASIIEALGKNLEDLRKIKILGIDDMDAPITIKSAHVLSYLDAFLKYRFENNLITAISAGNPKNTMLDQSMIEKLYRFQL